MAAKPEGGGMTRLLNRLPARAVVESYLASLLPPGTPPQHRSVAGVCYVGSGRNRVIQAELVMFDGLPGTIEIFQWKHGLGHRWKAMPGGKAHFFEDGCWRRESEDE
jgi:hypothetical protein